MRYSTFMFPAVLLLAAWSSTAATHATPQSSLPVDRAITAPPPPTAPVRAGEPGSARSGQGAPAGQDGYASDMRELAELRQKLWKEVLSQYPASVARDLQLSPLQLSDDSFLARYPALEAFLKEHPEVRLNADYFFPSLRTERDRRNGGPGFGGTIIAVVVPLATFVFLGVVAWLVYQRSVQRSAAQQELSGKVLDRLLAREDLAAYLDTPNGRRMLESVTRVSESSRTPATKIVDAVKAGVVFLVLGLGFVVLGPMVGMRSNGMVFFKVFFTGIGAGLVLAGWVSYLLSKRLGLIQTPDTRD